MRNQIKIGKVPNSRTKQRHRKPSSSPLTGPLTLGAPLVDATDLPLRWVLRDINTMFLQVRHRNEWRDVPVITDSRN